MSVGEVITLIASVAAVLAAVVTGIFTFGISERTRDHAVELENLKSYFSKDIESLKARLGHGQLISSTQWNAEFTAYQALWKSLVPLRALANKIVNREGELATIGLEQDDVPEGLKLANIENLLRQYAEASQTAMAAINEHAPFYPADIRKKANEVHGSIQHLPYELGNVCCKKEESASTYISSGQRRYEAPRRTEESHDWHRHP